VAGLSCTGNGHGPLEGLHRTAMGPPTHTQGTPRLPRSFQSLSSGPCLSRQGSTCLALASSRGEGETTAAQSAPQTPSLDPTPLLCEAKLSEAKLWPCPTPSLPPSPSTQAHTPLQPLGGRVHRRPHQGAWGVGGPGESKAPRQEESRGERCWGGGRACTCARHQAGTQAAWAGQEGTHTGPCSR
jgi:hypothetical protein